MPAGYHGGDTTILCQLHVNYIMLWCEIGEQHKTFFKVTKRTERTRKMDSVENVDDSKYNDQRRQFDRVHEMSCTILSDFL